MSYNGWKNHATWLVNLHIDNTYRLSDHYCEMAGEMLASYNGDKTEATYAVSDMLKENLTDMIQNEINDSAYLALDLVNGYLSEVDWDEIALHYVAEAVFESA